MASCGRRWAEARAPRIAATTLIALAALALVATATLAHGTHVEADPQVTADDKVRVEGVLSSQDGWIAVHAVDDRGDPGEVLGHAPLQPDAGFRTDVEVPLDANRTPTRGAQPVAVALRANQGDPGFDPGEDPIMETVAGPTIDRITLGFAERTAYISAVTFGPQNVTDGNVTIRSVIAPQASHLVLVHDEEGNRTFASRTLSAGVHRNLTVDLDHTGGREGQLSMRVVLHEDDGDGAFGGEEPPIRAGNETVATSFAIEVAEAASPGNATEAPEGNDSAADERSTPGVGLASALLLAFAAALARHER